MVIAFIYCSRILENNSEVGNKLLVAWSCRSRNESSCPMCSLQQCAGTVNRCLLSPSLHDPWHTNCPYMPLKAEFFDSRPGKVLLSSLPLHAGYSYEPLVPKAQLLSLPTGPSWTVCSPYGLARCITTYTNENSSTQAWWLSPAISTLKWYSEIRLSWVPGHSRLQTKPSNQSSKQASNQPTPTNEMNKQ